MADAEHVRSAHAAQQRMNQEGRVTAPVCFATLALDREDAEERRLCIVRGPHDWHQDRFDPSFRWKVPMTAPARTPTAPSADSGPSS